MKNSHQRCLPLYSSLLVHCSVTHPATKACTTIPPIHYFCITPCALTSSNTFWKPTYIRYRAFSLPGQFAPRSESANRTPANSLPGPFAPWPFRSLELSRRVYVAIYFLSSKFSGHFAPGSESSRERIGRGAIGRFAPGSELNRPGSEKAVNRIHRRIWTGSPASISLTCINLINYIFKRFNKLVRQDFCLIPCWLSLISASCVVYLIVCL